MPSIYVLRLCRALLMVVLAAPLLAAQAQPGSAGPPQAGAEKKEPSLAERAAQAQKKAAEQGPQSPKKAYKISAEEAQQLFQEADRITEFITKTTGLKSTKRVDVQLASRDTVEKFMLENLANDEDAKKMQQAEIVLKKFGLLPREFNLKTFLVAVLKEKVAGYYDAKKKKLFLLDWIGPEEHRPVLAHELTHAVQDQNVDLEAWGNAKEKAAEKSGDINARLAADEDSGARHAVVEGQATAVLVDFMLAPTGRSIEDSPQLVAIMRNAMLNSPENDSPMFTTAPMFIREALLFPYSAGLGFVTEVLVERGRDGAYGKLLSAPPSSSRQILMPKTYLTGETVPPLVLPDMKTLIGSRYQQWDLGSIGQFDVELLLKQYGVEGPELKLAREWRGGAYYGAIKAAAAKDPKLTTSDVAMLYVSRWSSAQAAQEFAKVYIDGINKRYRALLAAVQQGPMKWNTEEGGVWLKIQGDTVIVAESFDELTAAKLFAAIKSEGAQPKQAATAVPNRGLAEALLAPVANLHVTFVPAVQASKRANSLASR